MVGAGGGAEAGGSWVGEVIAETRRSRGRRNEHLGATRTELPTGQK